MQIHRERQIVRLPDIQAFSGQFVTSALVRSGAPVDELKVISDLETVLRDLSLNGPYA